MVAMTNMMFVRLNMIDSYVYAADDEVGSKRYMTRGSVRRVMLTRSLQHLCQRNTLLDRVPRISSPIRLHPASRNSASSLPVLCPLRPIPVMPDGQQPPDGLFPVVVPAPMLHSACWRSQNRARGFHDSGGRALPIVPLIPLG